MSNKKRLLVGRYRAPEDRPRSLRGEFCFTITADEAALWADLERVSRLSEDEQKALEKLAKPDPALDAAIEKLARGE